MLDSISRVKTVKVIVVTAAIVSTSSCVSREQIKDGASKTVSVVTKGVGKGVDGVKALTSGKLGTKRKVSREEALAIAEKYPTSGMPHTVMTKPIAQGTFTSGFGYRLSPAGIPVPKSHKGVDYSAPEGTAIYAAESGTVDKKYVSTSFGKYIRVKHNNGFSTVYAHMSSFADGMAVGTKVTKGQQIGAVGSTGKSTGPHLHFELHYNGRPIDPFFAKPLS